MFAYLHWNNHLLYKLFTIRNSLCLDTNSFIFSKNLNDSHEYLDQQNEYVNLTGLTITDSDSLGITESGISFAYSELIS